MLSPPASFPSSATGSHSVLSLKTVFFVLLQEDISSPTLILPLQMKILRFHLWFGDQFAIPEHFSAYTCSPIVLFFMGTSNNERLFNAGSNGNQYHSYTFSEQYN